MRDLLEPLENASKDASANEGYPIDPLKRTLISQLQGEEQHFFSLLSRIKKARDEVSESAEERHFTDLVLKELDKLDQGAAMD